MRIVIMGTGPFAVPACQRVVAEGHTVPLVITRPVADPTAKKQPPRPVFQWAQQAGLEIYEPASINEPAAVERLADVKADLFFVCDYGQILSRTALATARLGGINLHGSLLPRHRGAAPVQWTLLSGDSQAGVTVIHMTPRLDAGPALSIISTTIRPDESAAELEPRLAEIGVEATVAAIDMLKHWDGVEQLGELQDASLITKAPRFSKADGQLDFSRPAIELERQVRACQPWPGTFAELTWPDGKRMRLLVRAARGLPSTLTALQGVAAGTAIALAADDLGSSRDPQRDWSAHWGQLLAVAAGPALEPKSTLLISRVQPAGKREMSVEEFLRGHPITGQAKFEVA